MLPVSFVVGGVDPECGFYGRQHVLSLSQEVERKFILEKQEEIHVDVELLEPLLIAITKASKELAIELHRPLMLVAEDVDQALARCLLFFTSLLLKFLLAIFIIG